MHKKITIVIILVLLLIVSAFMFVALRPKAGQQAITEAQSTTLQSESEVTTPQPAAQPEEAGKYVNYDEAAVAGTSGRKLLFFHAAWCPQCRNLEKTILEGPIPSNMTIFKVNYDSASTLRQKYGVTLQTTIIEVDDQGKAVKKHVAYDDPTLPAVIKALGQ